MTDEEAQALPVHLDADTLASAEISTWMTDAGGFDILPGLASGDGRLMPYEELVRRETVIAGEGFTSRAAALEDIITAKEQADRPKDREAPPDLRALLLDSDHAGAPTTRPPPDAGPNSGARATSHVPDASPVAHWPARKMGGRMGAGTRGSRASIASWHE